MSRESRLGAELQIMPVLEKDRLEGPNKQTAVGYHTVREVIVRFDTLVPIL